MTFDITAEFSAKIADKRTISDVLGVAMEELGELATEIAIAKGFKPRLPGKDGIIGECVDVITAIEDIIFLTDATMTQAKLNAIKVVKCDKWLNSKVKF